MKNFALIGAAGYIAPKHFKAIKETGNELVAATDPHDSVGVLDSFFPEASFFTEIERFDRHLEKLRRDSEQDRVHYLSICSPNYLHDAHIRLALRLNAHAICEKPLLISPKNLNYLSALEQEKSTKVYAILQLRLIPAVKALKEKVENNFSGEKKDIVLTYITRRGTWYNYSWKGSQEKSGGVAMNIGIHFFDLLMHLFGAPEKNELHLSDSQKMAGYLELEKARVRWYLSVDGADLPDEVKESGGYAHRSLSIDGEEFNLSNGFTDLHTESYKEILAGRGFGIEDARAGLEIVSELNHQDTVSSSTYLHPILARRRFTTEKKLANL